MQIVFGGAFNPVTNAHIDIYHFLKDEFPNATFTFLPVSNAYTKSSLASNYHRLNMLELAVKGLEDVRISTLELNDTDFLGTYQSLIRLSDLHEEDIYFVMGADNLTYLDQWKNASGLLSEFKFIILGRNNINIHSVIKENTLLHKFKSHFIIYEDFHIDMSSTEFRETLNQALVPQCVYDYIKENNLYQGDDDVL
ncbi:MAG: nicotinate (nicotinamide) nucleotide adenylyltransferase [Candidatus Izemoplasma sp.]|nr:nicotinate (nicotinamide) nucleotide adenylyltransferase [Candidatus Izemoplasma sp.]